jgi:membrane protease YdiL (CAAX protease family)
MQPEITTPPPLKRLWGPGLTIAFGLVIFLFYGAAQTLVALFFAVDQFTANPNIDVFQMAQNLSSNGLMISIATIFSAVVGIGFIYWFIKRRKGFSFAEYLELKSLTGRKILLLCGLGLVLIAASALINSVLGIPDDTSGFTVEAFRSSVSPALFGIAVVIFAPAFEETFFRGFLFVGLKHSRLGSIGTIVITALIWAALHLQYDIYGMLTILVLGVILGVVRLKTGTLWGPLVIHAFWNLLTFISVSLVVNGIIK